jgi:hypothetical protein
MPRFVTRNVTINAVQFTGDIAFWPEAFRLAVRRHLSGGITEIMTGDGVRACRYGDWVVNGPDGAMTVWKDAAFEAFFAPKVEAESIAKSGKRAA